MWVWNFNSYRKNTDNIKMDLKINRGWRCRLNSTFSELDPEVTFSEHKGQVKVKLSLCFNKAPRHEGELGEWRYSSTHSLASALDRGKWSALHPSRFAPRERTLGNHWIGGWVDTRAVLDAVVKRKIHSPRRELNPNTPIVQPVAQQ
jgi:hypothetical protein